MAVARNHQGGFEETRSSKQQYVAVRRGWSIGYRLYYIPNCVCSAGSLTVLDYMVADRHAATSLYQVQDVLRTDLPVGAYWDWKASGLNLPGDLVEDISEGAWLKKKERCNNPLSLDIKALVLGCIMPFAGPGRLLCSYLQV